MNKFSSRCHFSDREDTHSVWIQNQHICELASQNIYLYQLEHVDTELAAALCSHTDVFFNDAVDLQKGQYTLNYRYVIFMLSM